MKNRTTKAKAKSRILRAIYTESTLGNSLTINLNLETGRVWMVNSKVVNMALSNAMFLSREDGYAAQDKALRNACKAAKTSAQLIKNLKEITKLSWVATTEYPKS